MLPSVLSLPNQHRLGVMAMKEYSEFAKAPSDECLFAKYKSLPRPLNIFLSSQQGF